MKEINEAYDAITKMRSGNGRFCRRFQPFVRHYGQQGYGGALRSISRRCVMRSTVGILIQAETLLRQMPERNAEWHFLTGSVAYRKGLAG
ncbi:MAG: hypothetical protein ACOX0U_02390 [Oscillospiraceae bacterium]